MKYGSRILDDSYVQTRVLPRLIAHAKPEGECLVWTRSLSRGYGRIAIRDVEGATIHAKPHRLIAILFYGDIGSLDVDHTCRNPRCINIAHLKPCTNAENNRLKNARNRADRYVNQLVLPHALFDAMPNYFTENQGDEPEQYPEVVECVGQTDGGALKMKIVGSDTCFFVPASVVHDDSEVFEPGQSGTLLVKRWFAEKDGWV